VTAAFVLAATVVGQALAWAGTALRQTKPGRLVTNGLVALLIAVAVLRGDQDSLFALADQTPLVPLLASGFYPVGPRWLLTLLLLGSIALAARAVGVVAVSWTLRLSTEITGYRESRRIRRRPSSRGPLGALLTMFLDSVVRSRPIRRGLLLLVVFPVVVASVAELSWVEIIVLPGLVAAGSALLFAVNGLSLLGGGAAWLGSVPLRSATLLTALAGTIGITVAGTTLATTVGVAVFAPAEPRPAELIALVCAALATSAWVMATSVWLSVRRPYQADLRGNRDTPAPPGVMAAYSLRLAGAAGVVGLLMSATAQLQTAATAVVFAILIVGAATVRLLVALRAWTNPDRRSRALLAVAFG
jgi:hypothetical protein